MLVAGMNELRIVSFLPAATEMVCALGLADHLVGITHECDYPAEIRTKPVVVRPAIAMASMSLQEIDATVSSRIRSGASLYAVDERLLQQLSPTLILTQDLCQVCAPSGNEITKVLKSLRPTPQILWFKPRSIGGIEENLRALGNVTDRLEEAEKLIRPGKGRLEQVAAVTQAATSRPRVFFMEWVDPVYCSGHWVPEMLELAGGVDALSRKAADSVRITWQQVLDWAPEVLIISPCGFNLNGARQQASQLSARPGWADLPAVRLNRVFAVDANSYFSRPGPRTVEGVELLARLIHPELGGWAGPSDAFERVPQAYSN
jgi:iron complex transport system substrate-binding protein